MSRDFRDTVVGRSTIHPDRQLASMERPDISVRHAEIVIRRMLRRNSEDDALQERVIQAARLLNAAEHTRTAFSCGNAVSAARRIAIRALRKVRP